MIKEKKQPVVPNSFEPSGRDGDQGFVTGFLQKAFARDKKKDAFSGSGRNKMPKKKKLRASFAASDVVPNDPDPASGKHTSVLPPAAIGVLAALDFVAAVIAVVTSFAGLGYPSAILGILLSTVLSCIDEGRERFYSLTRRACMLAMVLTTIVIALRLVLSFLGEPNLFLG